MDPRAVDLLILHEGWRPWPYDDATGREVRAPAGKLTIGYGLNLQDAYLTKGEARWLLEHRLESLEDALAGALPEAYNALSPVRRAVLLDMAYNLGLAGLLAFKHTLDSLRRAVRGEVLWTQVSGGMLNSRWAQQVGGRADRLARMMATDSWPLEIN